MTTTTRRIRWDRADRDSALRAALRLASADGAPRYVFATYNGWDIGTDRIDSQGAFRCHASMLVEMVGRDGVVIESKQANPEAV